MKNERTDEWGYWLLTTPLMQGKGALHKVDPETNNHLFCCLGIGVEKSQAYESKEEQESDSEFARNGETIMVYAYDGADGLPDIAFYKWLGFTDKDFLEAGHEPEATDSDGLDCYLDAPGVKLQDNWNTHLGQLTLATLNDSWDLTFPEIGDLIIYFGISLRSN